jgi:hypothetical protein
MRSIIDGTRIQDSKFVQGLFWATVFKSSAGAFALPDDPESTYVFNPTAAGEIITLPRIIGNTVYGGPTGLLAGTHVIDGLWLELLNLTTATGTLQAQTAAGDGATNVGAVIPVAPAGGASASMGQYQIINGVWRKIL